MDLHDGVQDQKPPSGGKAPVVRGARACRTCRQAKMKCVGGEDGEKQCQRCKRTNVECIFEKHRRGRKPGSKLSEASKMLRKFEKGLNSAKLKSQSTDTTMPSPYNDRHPSLDPSYSQQYRGPYNQSVPRLSQQHELPSLHTQRSPYMNGTVYPSSAASLDEEDDPERANDGLFPAKMIRKERDRNSFFRTILNPEDGPPESTTAGAGQSTSIPRMVLGSEGLSDPITMGIIDMDFARVLFDALYIRLNPFINLFDPALHTVEYVREKCPFLFTTMIMAGCKFYQPNFYKRCQKLANEFALHAFASAWKSVEVVQAFSCLTYWKEAEDNCTWTYIGYASRMAVELGLNRYTSKPPVHETELQRLERRNRERTYLVLFVNDRSLSFQTGRNWMLPEDEFIRHAITWHTDSNSSAIRPEDVIVAAFVQLRRIAAEATDRFHTSNAGGGRSDSNYDGILRHSNLALTQWNEHWEKEMGKANGQSFHYSFLNFFRLYDRLFLNSFGTKGTGANSPNVQALSFCYTSALDLLRIVSEDFGAKLGVLIYGQDATTIMSAYAAVFLLELLRNSFPFLQMYPDAANEIHNAISQAADAYHKASLIPLNSNSSALHARFLHNLISNDIFKAKRSTKVPTYDAAAIDSRLQGASGGFPVQQEHYSYTQHVPSPDSDYPPSNGRSMTNASMPLPATNGNNPSVPPVPPSSSGPDAHYWKMMFEGIGFSQNVEHSPANSRLAGPGGAGYSDIRHQQAPPLAYQMQHDYNQQ